MTRQLGPYRLEKLLGRGGMGSVYVGVHEQTGERTAIKSLSHSLADDENFRSRFLVEIQTLKQLRHPNIVQILGDGEQDGELFYVMELVEGQTLQDLLQSGHSFQWREVIRIAIEVCGALKHAHDCGVIHRDLKPANLLRAQDGSVKLTDFGIAKLFGASHHTAAGSVVGTADYMSPEQSDGRPVSHRTDLYSLGAVMFTLLTRRSPFQGGTLAQVVHRLKYEEAPPVRRFAPQVPEPLDQLIGELLRKDPQQRVATALALANRLRAMEHVLSARREGMSDEDGGSTRLGKKGGPPDTAATAMVVPGQGASTRMAPTLPELDPSGGKGFAWNDATIETSSPQAADPGSGASAPRDVPAVLNRFTAIDEGARQRVARAGLDARPNKAWRHVAGIGLLLAAIVGLCVWGMRPVSADSLYREITSIAQRESPADAWKLMDDFVRRFPDDPRFPEVRALRMDVESDWIEGRLLRRKRKTDGMGLEPYEQKWLEAYLLRQKQPAEARLKWESILDEYARQPDPPDSLQIILTATRHQLARLDQPERDR
jgi:serine/threonine-protein kinase